VCSILGDQFDGGGIQILKTEQSDRPHCVMYSRISPVEMRSVVDDPRWERYSSAS
jgi:hypothetical protein